LVQGGAIASPTCRLLAPMYLILHGFSRRNAGDGVLVDLALEALKQAGISQTECHLLALDPETFVDLEHVHRAPGDATARSSLQLCLAGLELVADYLSLGRVARLASNARGLIAVGGGYLVTDSPVRQMGVLFNHLVQLKVASRSQVPTIYLPQSIGPLKGPVGRATAGDLKFIDRLYVRDDQSLAEVSGDNVRRCSDLAVMKLARMLGHSPWQEPGDGRTVIVGRELPRAGSYEARLFQLARMVPSPQWAVQSDIKGPRSDRAYYQRLGIANADPLAQVLEAGRTGAVVSVRLHGAIAALMAGRPAIHLAYERKSWGAYEDLGITEYVHDARTFDAAKVAEQVNALQHDPRHFWAKVWTSVPSLQKQYADLVTDLRQRLTD
jgi:polysaccharide pyruvyl transferase WcaK-like protein